MTLNTPLRVGNNVKSYVYDAGDTLLCKCDDEPTAAAIVERCNASENLREENKKLHEACDAIAKLLSGDSVNFGEFSEAAQTIAELDQSALKPKE
jgi:hypothetical protein